MDNENANEQQQPYVSQIYGEAPQEASQMNEEKPPVTPQIYGEVPPTMPQKKSKLPFIILGVILVVIIAAGAAAYVLLNSPKARLAKGVANMLKELSAYDDKVSEKINRPLLAENKRKSPHTTTVDLTVTVPEDDDMGNLNITMNAGLDYTNRLADIDFKLGVFHLNLIEGNMIVDNNQMYVSLPKLLKDTYSMKLDTLGADYNRSEWKNELEYELEEDFSLDIFEEEQESEYDDVDEIQEQLEADISLLKNSISIGKVPEKVTIQRSGKDYKCSGVSVTIPRDAMNTFLDRFQEEFMNSSLYQDEVTRTVEEYATAYFVKEDIQEMVDEYTNDILGIRCKNDLTLYLYMDSHSHILRIATPSKIEFKDSNLKGIQMKADFTGTDRTLDVINAECTVETVDETETFEFGRDASVTNEIYDENITFDYIDNNNTTVLSLGYTNTWNLTNAEFDSKVSIKMEDESAELSAEGGYSNIIEGEGYTLDISTASLVLDGETIVRTAGTISIAPGMKETTVPEQSVSFFDMDSTAIYSMLYEMISSFDAEGFY